MHSTAIYLTCEELRWRPQIPQRRSRLRRLPVAVDINAKSVSQPSAVKTGQTSPSHARRKWPWIVGLILLAWRRRVHRATWLLESLNTVSTDDAYVNGHVTFVAPRVSGQVVRVLVDDNNVVHKGDLLVELDPEPFQVQVDIAQAAVTAAQADLVAAQATVRGNEGLTRSLRYGLQHAIEDVDDKVATLKLRVASLDSKKASLAKAQADYNRNKPLVASGTVTQQDMDAYTEASASRPSASARSTASCVSRFALRSVLPPVPEAGQRSDAGAGRSQSNVFFCARSAGQADAGGGRAGRDATRSTNRRSKWSKIFTNAIPKATSTASTPSC